ncbi:MAG: MFS transporter [Candidatus Eisenbacteria bacterium]
MPRKPPTGPLMTQRSFSALWWGQLVSILGDRFNYLALLGLLATHTDSFRDPRASLLLSLLANVMLAPVLLFSPFAGAWIDRVNLRRVLIASDTLRAVLVALIPAVYMATHNTFPVFVLVFLLFTCNVFFLPAKSAITPEIVPEEQLLAANALLSGAGIAATAVGALVGGWVVDHWGWARALYIDAATYLVSVLTLWIVRYRPRPPHPVGSEMTAQGYLGEVGEGWKLVQRTPAVRLGMLTLSAVWIGGGFLHVAGNQHIQRAALIPGMERVGVLMCALGLGAGLGTWWVDRKARRIPRHLLLGSGLVLAAGFVVAFAVSSRFAVYAISAFALGFCIAPVFVLSETLLQLGTDLTKRGRIFSARDFVMRLVFMLAVAVAGTVTRAEGTEVALLTAAAIVAAVGALTLWRGDPGPEPANGS